MAETKGKLATCDRCHRSVFLKAIGNKDVGMDGEVKMENKFEPLPEEWGWGYLWSFDRILLCPSCSKEVKTVLDAFMRKPQEKGVT
jgi:hypothetical protein